METLSETLQPYKDSVGSVASVVTILQFFSGVFICKDIYQKASTRDISALPFIGGIVIGILMLKYANILNDPNMYVVNIAAIILNVLYLCFYLTYSQSKPDEVFAPASKGTALTVLLLAYVAIEDPNEVEFRYSLIMTSLMLLLLGSPLIEVKEIIRKKDASSIPLPMTFMGFVVSMLWLAYGIILMNYFMVVQNSLGALLCFFQLVLIAFYWRKPEVSAKKEKKLN